MSGIRISAADDTEAATHGSDWPQKWPARFCCSSAHRQRHAKLGCHHGGSARSPFQRLGYLRNSGSGLRHCLQLPYVRFCPLATNNFLSFSHFSSGFCKAGRVRHDNGNRMTKRCACAIKLESNEAFTHMPMRLRSRRRHALCLPTQTCPFPRCFPNPL
jgi:hypothetical protein